MNFTKEQCVSVRRVSHKKYCRDLLRNTSKLIHQLQKDVSIFESEIIKDKESLTACIKQGLPTEKFEKNLLVNRRIVRNLYYQLHNTKKQSKLYQTMFWINPVEKSTDKIIEEAKKIQGKRDLMKRIKRLKSITYLQENGK